MQEGGKTTRYIGISRPSHCACGPRALYVGLLVLGLLGGPVGAQYGGGTGTADDPYRIHTTEQVARMGSLVAWGGEGQWDKGQTQVPPGEDYVAVAAGMYHSLALTADGAVVAWGDNSDQQCDAPAGDDYVAIEAGFRHSLALNSDGTLAAWGSNADGQCDVPAGSDYIAIAAGADHCLALKADGSVVAWGNNQHGQCNVPPGLVVQAIAGGWRHSLALTTEGSLLAWGSNWSGESDVPVGSDFAAITCGDHHNLAQRTDGAFAAWGLQADGRCDLPAGTQGARAFRGGGHHSLVLKADGSLVAWGNCAFGQCDAPAGTDYIAIAAGTHHNLAIKAVTPARIRRRVTLEHVTVGNPGNPDDTHRDLRGRTYGAVPYIYRIGKYEVTAAQYCAFLNAVAADDPHGLYDPAMAQGDTQYDSGCRIQRHGQPGSYTYGVASDWANRPVNLVSFWDACRFANWLHNGQPAGPQDPNSTEDGAYTLNGYAGDDGREIARKPTARVWIPGASEWYKAAYHKNDGVTNHYWDYPTGTDTQPSNDLIDPDPGNNANFAIRERNDYTLGPPYWRAEVGEFENSESPYGTYDQAGNMREWTDDLMSEDDSDRIQQGCSYLCPINHAHANQMGQHAWGPHVGNPIVGFRVAAERLKGDITGRSGTPDGIVDFVDFAALARAWATSEGHDDWRAACDVSPDGRIDMRDVSIFAESWLTGDGAGIDHELVEPRVGKARVKLQESK